MLNGLDEDFEWEFGDSLLPDDVAPPPLNLVPLSGCYATIRDSLLSKLTAGLDCAMLSGLHIRIKGAVALFLICALSTRLELPHALTPTYCTLQMSRHSKHY